MSLILKALTYTIGKKRTTVSIFQKFNLKFKLNNFIFSSYKQLVSRSLFAS